MAFQSQVMPTRMTVEDKMDNDGEIDYLGVDYIDDDHVDIVEDIDLLLD